MSDDVFALLTFTQHSVISSLIQKRVVCCCRKWLTDGCKRIGGTDDYSLCQCDHMTNFAVLLDVSGASGGMEEEHVLSLTIITYAGCVISIVCLLLSWLTFQFLK